MKSLEEIIKTAGHSLEKAGLELIDNSSPCGERSILVDPSSFLALVELMRDDDEIGIDYLSNVTGVDWPEKIVKEMVDGKEKEVAQTIENTVGGYLEVIYHFYSVQHKSGPWTLRMRTGDREENVTLPSITPIFQSADFQEREVFDLYGIRFEGHPDLRRIFMWDEFEDYPMRKDYEDPDDYEYEPTPHKKVLVRTQRHHEGNDPGK
jgi:NADH-quinone oxidoreductase subunit C